MISKLNDESLCKHEFTKLLRDNYNNETPKITFIQNEKKEYKLKLHFLELIYESNKWNKSLEKGVELLLTEATPLLKMCLTKYNNEKVIELISMEKLKELMNINNISSETNLNKEYQNYDIINKQKYDFTENFINFDISQSDEEETPLIDLFSHTNKKLKMSSTPLINNSLIDVQLTEEYSNNKIIINTNINNKEINNNEIENNYKPGIYEKKLINFIKENSIPSFKKQNKTLKKLHKSIITFIDDIYESKYHLSLEKAEDEVFKKICIDYEL